MPASFSSSTKHCVRKLHAHVYVPSKLNGSAPTSSDACRPMLPGRDCWQFVSVCRQRHQLTHSLPPYPSLWSSPWCQRCRLWCSKSRPERRSCRTAKSPDPPHFPRRLPLRGPVPTRSQTPCRSCYSTGRKSPPWANNRRSLSSDRATQPCSLGRALCACVGGKGMCRE